MNLTEWTTHHIKFKDCMKKQIKDMDISEEKIVVTEKKGDIKTYFINNKLEKLIPHIEKETTILVCLNNKENAQTIINNWNKLIEYPNLTIICAEPNKNDSWTIHPTTHNRITEKESLETGILALAEEKK